jgi:hypothetical protein
MTDVIVERDFEDPIAAEQVGAMLEEAGGCLGLYRINWHSSYLADDGRKMVCHFSAPDTETARTALHQVGAVVRTAWPATIHTGSNASLTPNVVVERDFEQAVTMESIQALEDAGSGCLDVRDVRFVQTFFSVDHTRMLCLYNAPDAEAVRAAQDEAKVPFARVWSAQLLQAIE